MKTIEELDNWQQELYESEEFESLIKEVSKKLVSFVHENGSPEDTEALLNLKSILVEDTFKSKLAYQFFIELQQRMNKSEEETDIAS